MQSQTPKKREICYLTGAIQKPLIKTFTDSKLGRGHKCYLLTDGKCFFSIQPKLSNVN